MSDRDLLKEARDRVSSYFSTYGFPEDEELLARLDRALSATPPSQQQLEEMAEEYGKAFDRTAFTKEREGIPMRHDFAECYLAGARAMAELMGLENK